MKHKKIVLTSDNCCACLDYKEEHKKEIEEGMIKLVDINTKEGLKLVKENNIMYIPHEIEVK